MIVVSLCYRCGIAIGCIAHVSAGAEKKANPRSPFSGWLAEWTGLEPATPGVTGRYSNQLNYHSLYSRKSRLSIRLLIPMQNAADGGC
jgi:hypothetical protein